MHALNLVLAACLAALFSPVESQNTDTVPATGSLTTESVQYVSTANSLDAPHIIGISPQVYEWWWFDAESPDLDTSVVIVFFTASAVAFPLVAGIPSDTSIVVNAKLPNGTTIISEAAANGAVIKSGGSYGNGAFGEWNGFGNFSVSPDLSTATIHIDLWGLPTPIRGSITFHSIAPAHYPCSTNLNPGNNLLIAPHVGWSNAMPAAITTGTFQIAGELGDTPFLTAISSWYWGHAHFGPWSIVLFNGTTATGDPFADAYVSENGHLLVSSCQKGSALVTPTLDVLGNVKSISVTIPIPGQKPVVATLVATSINVDYPGVYSRYLISASGGQRGGPQYSGGTGTLEHFGA